VGGTYSGRHLGNSCVHAYVQELEGAQQKLESLSSSAQSHWERLCEVAASVHELQQRPLPGESKAAGMRSRHTSGDMCQRLPWCKQQMRTLSGPRAVAEGQL